MYPSTLSSFTDPQANDKLNAPSHSAIERAQNAGIEAIEGFVGTLSSTAGTLIYDVRATASDGGGHVQSANKGGTGQTSYTKGDLLVATSSSVLSKLAVGTDRFFLTADSTQAAGVKWANSGSKVQVVSSQLGVSGVSTETVIFAASILGSVLGTNNAIKYTAAISQLSLAAARSVEFRVKYGNNTISNVGGGSANASAALDMNGRIEGIIIGNGATNAQKIQTNYVLADSSGNSETTGNADIDITKFIGTDYRTSSVLSDATQNLIITAQMGGANSFGSVVGQFIVIEKIN